MSNDGRPDDTDPSWWKQHTANRAEPACPQCHPHIEPTNIMFYPAPCAEHARDKGTGDLAVPKKRAEVFIYISGSD